MKILVGIDGGNHQGEALALAADLARTEGAELVVAHAYPWAAGSARMGAPGAAQLHTDAESVMASANETLSGVDHKERLIPSMSPPRALHEVATEEGADLLVIGPSHRSAVRRALLGSVGDRVVHGSPVPVVVAPRGYTSDGAPRRIGVAYDGSDESKAALAWARQLAERTGGELSLITAADPTTGVYPAGAGFYYDDVLQQVREERRRELDAAVGELPDELHPTGTLVEGPAAPSIAQAAGELDVLVVGSRGYGPIGGLLLGSVSRGLMHTAECPVVILPRTAAARPETTSPETGAATVR